jgi:hypothetical protein
MKCVYPLKAQWLLNVPSGVTFKIKHSTHRVHLCFFLRISEQTAIISLYSINWLVFITETECVYCALRAEYLKPWFRVLVAGLLPPTPGFDPRSVHVRFVVDKGALGQVFLQVLWISLVSISPHQCAILISIYMLLLPKGQTGEAWEPSKKQCSFGKGGE